MLKELSASFTSQSDYEYLASAVIVALYYGYWTMRLYWAWSTEGVRRILAMLCDVIGFISIRLLNGLFVPSQKSADIQQKHGHHQTKQHWHELVDFLAGLYDYSLFMEFTFTLCDKVAQSANMQAYVPSLNSEHPILFLASGFKGKLIERAKVLAVFAAAYAVLLFKWQQIKVWVTMLAVFGILFHTRS